MLICCSESWLKKLYAHLPSWGDSILVKGLTPNAPCFQSSQSLKSQDLLSAFGTPDDSAMYSHTRFFHRLHPWLSGFLVSLTTRPQTQGTGWKAVTKPPFPLLISFGSSYLWGNLLMMSSSRQVSGYKGLYAYKRKQIDVFQRRRATYSKCPVTYIPMRYNYVQYSETEVSC